MDEVKEAGEEIVHQITESTNDYLEKLILEKEEIKEVKKEMEEMLIAIYAAKEEIEKAKKEEEKLMQSIQEIDKMPPKLIEDKIIHSQAKDMLKNEKQGKKTIKMPTIGIEKKKAILSMYRQDYPLEKIAKKWNISIGVVELLIEMENDKKTASN